MAKAKRNIGVEILEGLREIKRGDYGRVINIEQGRRAPSGAARTLLIVASKNPRALLDVA